MIWSCIVQDPLDLCYSTLMAVKDSETRKATIEVLEDARIDERRGGERCNAFVIPGAGEL